MIHTIISDSVEKTRELGALFAHNVDTPRVFALLGDLGCGKTEFTRGFAKQLIGSDEAVSSPTFMLWNLYENEKFAVNHLDLYRLDSAEDVLELGISDVWESADNFTLIEWAEKIEEILPQNVIKIYFKHIDENTREISFESISTQFDESLAKFM